MAIEREPGQWYVGGTMPAFSGPPPFGWVERIDPDTLEVLASSPQLPCGEHVWCGAILAHANGSIMSVNGNYLHRLDPDDLSIIAERELPVSRSHNGLLALADGSLITKDLRLEGQGGTTITRLDPDTLDLVAAPLVLPEGSMGRIASDLTNELDVAWTIADVRPSMQPVVYPESGELVINDFTDAGNDDIIVVDIGTGELLDRVSTGSRIANGMFLSPGPGRSIFYCSTLTVARVTWS